jgi:hypothetical protein
MKDFIEHINPRLKDFTKFELSRSHEYKVRDQVIKHFNLKDVNQLRDKFEGVAFLEKTYKKAIAIWIASKVLKIELIKLEDFEPQLLQLNFFLEKKNWEIIIFDYGDIPKFKIKKEYNYILILKRDVYCFYFCGILMEENCSEMIEESNNNPGFKFTNFGILSKSINFQ